MRLLRHRDMATQNSRQRRHTLALSMAQRRRIPRHNRSTLHTLALRHRRHAQPCTTNPLQRHRRPDQPPTVRLPTHRGRAGWPRQTATRVLPPAQGGLPTRRRRPRHPATHTRPLPLRCANPNGSRMVDERRRSRRDHHVRPTGQDPTGTVGYLKGFGHFRPDIQQKEGF